jgi:hypothetical protein
VDFEGLRATVADLCADAARLKAAPPPAPAEESLLGLRADISTLKSRLAVLLPSAPEGFASLIVADFPVLFAEFRWKHFTLLWRGSGDGFGAGCFHSRCDGHAPTLALIQDSGGNVFGGFPPVEWESRKHDIVQSKALGRDNCLKADPSLNSFDLTLKNPHNFPAREFALKAEMKDKAIYCEASRSYDLNDIVVLDNCNRNPNSDTASFEIRYANDSSLNGRTFFTGSHTFTVKEIEVFEITD